MTVDAEEMSKMLPALEQYRITTHGPNDWIPSALANILATKGWMDKARDAIGGHYSSVYRSPAVNAAVGGVGCSRHVRGLAADITPGNGMAPQKAAEVLYRMAVGGKLGPVQQIIWEPVWVHVGWYSADETAVRISYIKREPDGGYSAIPRPSDDEELA